MRRNARWVSRALLTGSLSCVLVGLVHHRTKAAEVESDGGITLFVSYDSSQPGWSGELGAMVTEIEGEPGQVSNCTQPTAARGGPSPGSCHAAFASNSCTGLQKLRGDLEQLARYIYQSTQGAHYLKRVFVADRGRFWGTADILWDVGGGASESGAATSGAGWRDPDSQIRMRNARRTCIHDVVHHELGHYVYDLPDRYPQTQQRCTLDDASSIQRSDIRITKGDPNTVMTADFPHDFVDEGNASLEVEYDGQTQTLDLVHGFGPNRADWPVDDDCKLPFGLDEWSMLAEKHVDLEEAHEVGHYPSPDFDAMQEPEICFFPSDEPVPGIIVLVDRTKSMSVGGSEQGATKMAEEAALYLYHSSDAESYVGSLAYDLGTTPIYDYAPFDEERAETGFQDPAFFALPPPSGSSTDLGVALETALDALEAVHTGNCGPAGASIVLMSDGQNWMQNEAVWDQVGRAAALGVAIHTLTYGSVDDTPTMEAIAEGSSGSVTLVSGNEVPMQYKVDMLRMLNKLRGYHQLSTYPSGSGTFTVPYATRDLLFYVFLREGNAADVQVQLELCPDDADCELSTEGPGQFQEHFPGLANRGGFRGVRLEGKQGTWKYKVQALPGKPDPKILRVMALIRSPSVYVLAFPQAPAPALPFLELEWPEPRYVAVERKPRDKTGGGLQAGVRYRYPLAGIRAIAHVYDEEGQHVLDVPLRDGGSGAFDPREDDGIYSTPPTFYKDVASALQRSAKKGSQPPAGRREGRRGSGRSEASESKKVRVDVELTVTRDSFPANVPYEPGTELASLARDYAALIGENKEDFSLLTTTIIDLNPPELDPHIVFVRGRGRQIQRGRPGRLTVGLQNARPSKRQLRISLGQGVTISRVAVETVETRSRRTPDARLVIEYQISPSAKPGPRDLVLQFGKTIIGTSRALVVVATD